MMESDLSRDLVKPTDSILRNDCERFDFKDPQMNPDELSHILAQTMMKNNGLCLAAPQIGLPYRVFAVLSNPILCMFNPSIVDTTSEEIYLEEMSLTYPGIVVKVKRPTIIRIRFTQPDEKTRTEKYIGMTSRYIQQGMDSIDGITLKDVTTSYHWEQGVKKRKKNG